MKDIQKDVVLILKVRGTIVKMGKTQADQLIKKVEEARKELIEYIQQSVSKYGFNRIVEAGVNRATLAKFQREEEISTDILLKIKKCIDQV